MIVVDDDTSINVGLLSYGFVLSSYILQTTRTQQIVLDDMRSDIVTARGFFFGGAGYLMGRATPLNLSSTVISARKGKDGDSYRGAETITRLSVLKDALEFSKNQCPECVQVRPSVNGGFKTASCTLTGALGGISELVIDGKEIIKKKI